MSLLPYDDYLKLPVISLDGLQNYDPVTYSPMQQAMLPYLDMLQSAWWVCFFSVLTILLARYFIMPLAMQHKMHRDLSCPPFVTDPAPVAETELTGFWGRLRRDYIKIFSLKEIEDDVALRLFGGAILLGYIATFNSWQMSSGSTIDAIRHHGYICWPFFQGCKDWLWLRTLPNGYTQTVYFMVQFGIIVWTAHALLKRRIVMAHACIGVLFICKLYIMLIDFGHNGNFDYYHNGFNIVFLLLPRKRFFGSLLLVWFYFLSTATKIHPSWTWGGYFYSMRDGLPLIPKGWEPIFTNLIILMEMVMSWFMFSSNKILQRTVFLFFCFFHVYSGTLVGYHYPTIVMPSLVVFFGSLFKPFPSVPLGKASIPGWIFMGILLVTQLFSHTLNGDTKLTMEANHYGLYMFEANHQCRAVYLDGDTGETLYKTDNVIARNRCNPWTYLSHGKQRFCRKPGAKIMFRMIHSINGGPFYEIVDEPDMCNLQYNAFGHNDWIKDETTAPMVGRPKENFYK